MELDEDNINTKIKNINQTIGNLSDVLNNISKKIESINSIYMNYEYNKNLNLNHTNTYLKFQVDMLNNDKTYYTNLKNLFIKKFTTDMYNLLDSITIILVSMDDLDIGLDEEKKKIFGQILKFNKQKELNKAKVVELINVTVTNVKLIKKFIDLFEVYIVESEKDNIRNNIHSNNFKINLMHKKKHFELEYNTYSEKISELINYFNTFSEAINEQIENQKVLCFFINDKK